MRTTLFAVLGILAFCIVVILFINHGFTKARNTDTADYGPRMTDQSFTLQADFEDGYIASHYTCDGAGAPPPLTVRGTPSQSVSLALIMDDPDVPTALKPDGRFLHWVLFNIPASTTAITATSGTGGSNGSGGTGYTPPCPPKAYEPAEHRYVFTLYALDTELLLSSGASEEEVRAAMNGHVIAQTQLVGKYRRH